MSPMLLALGDQTSPDAAFVSFYATSKHSPQQLHLLTPVIIALNLLSIHLLIYIFFY